MGIAYPPEAGYKTFRIAFPRVDYTSADAIYETHFRMTMSHQWSETSQNMMDSRPDPYSLEIYCENGEIQFCYTARGHNITTLTSIVHLIYPDAIVEEIPDHFTDLPESSHVAVANMTYKRANIFPVLSYRAIKADPLHPFLNTLIEMPPNVRALFQMTSRTHFSVQGTYYGFEISTWWHRFKTLFRPKAWFKREVRQNEAEGIDEKSRANLMWASVHLAVVIDDPEGELAPNVAQSQMKRHLSDLVGGFSILKKIDWNWFVLSKVGYGRQQLSRLWERKVRKRRPWMQMSMNEQAAMWHLPRRNESISMYSVRARKWSAPPKLPDLRDGERVSPVGMTDWRGQSYPFGIHREDRRRHLLICGRSGVGKTRMLQTLLRSDVEQGYGCGLIAPSSELVEEVLALLPAHRVKDVVIIDPTDIDFPASLNPFDRVEEGTRMQVATGMLELFRRRFSKSWSSEIELVLLYLFLTLLSTKFTTVLALKRMLLNESYREGVVESLEDKNVIVFWRGIFPRLLEDGEERVLKPIIQMVEDFTASEMLYHCLGQPFNTFQFREILDEGKILLVKIPARELGAANAALLGGMVMSRIFQAAMSRADTPLEERRDFSLYIDEFDEFATESFEEVLSESRKYGLNLTLSSQSLSTLPPRVKGTLFTNIVNLISFALTEEDAPIVASELQPLVAKRDLIGLSKGNFYMKMSVESEAQPVFSGKLFSAEDLAVEDRGYGDEARALSRSHYCVPREKAVEIIREWGSFG
ncbi:type IV secretion system DNA-binding domain-containing protein [bacterium]|nr:type IV secretion system DNA-binding domain-containing protein [bacterium]